MQIQAPDQGKGQELVISDRDAAALQAYLGLLTAILRAAAEGDFENCIAELEQMSQNKPLWSLLLQLMCHPVPQVIIWL